MRQPFVACLLENTDTIYHIIKQSTPNTINKSIFIKYFKNFTTKTSQNVRLD